MSSHTSLSHKPLSIASVSAPYTLFPRSDSIWEARICACISISKYQCLETFELDESVAVSLEKLEA
jgi:hypothetical protein